MRTSTAYFAGVGTVVAAVVAGLGGGVLISNIVSPHAPKIEMSKLELRMSEKPIQASNVPSEPAPSVAATAANTVPTQAPKEPVTTGLARPQLAEAAAGPPPAASPPPAAAPVTQAATSEKTNPEPIKPPEPAVVKTRDSDIRARDADVRSRDGDIRREARRAAEEKRKAERRQHWVERRRPRQDQELREVEERVREERAAAGLCGRAGRDATDQIVRSGLIDPQSGRCKSHQLTAARFHHLAAGSESFDLLSRRQAFICGGLPICSAQNFPASERQAICSSRLGPDWAEANALPASRKISETKAVAAGVDC